MKLLLTSLLVMAGLLTYAQTTPSAPPELALARVAVKKGGASPVKMLCDPATNPLEVLSCEGEDRDNGTGDNNPGNGAFMTWTATGSNNFYYSQIYNATDTFTIVQGGTSNSVYAEGADGTYSATLAIGGNTTNACLDPGTWTVRVWDVLDDNGDLLPDRDANGDIIGCYAECTYTFLPSCPTGQPFDVDISNVGCTNGGSINLINFNPNDVYCDGQATFSWSGPNGFSSSNQNISGLEVGTYTFQLTDFYGCTTGPITVDVTTAPPVEITCGNPVAPSVFGASDGSFEVDITVGEGDYTIEWTGPATGSIPGVDGLNTVSGLPAGTYSVLVTDNDTGCTATCTVTIPDPPCEIAFEVSLDNIGNIILTMTGGRPNFFVAFSGTATASQDDLGPYSTSPITLSANLFEPGEYIFTVYEADRPDCSAFEIFIIEGPDCSTFEYTLEHLTEINCGGIDDGAIEISLSGGVNPTLTWVSGPGVSGSNDQSITNLGPGTYYFQAIDEQGCVLEDTYELTAPPPLQVVCLAAGETCEDADDGKIDLTISGGTGPYRLSYTALDFDGNPLPSGNDLAIMDEDSLVNLMPGEYAVQIEDANGCTANCMTTVEEIVCPNIPIGGSDQTVQLDSIIDATQLNGSGGVIVSFGGAPDWTYFITSTTTGFDTTITTSVVPDTTLGLPIDTYRLTLIRAIDTIMIDSMLLDSLNISACCVSQGTAPTFDFIVRGPECMLAATPAVQNPACFGEASGNIDLNISGANGGIAVAWDSPSLSGTSPTGVPAGTYTATITDDAGCEIVQMVELFDPPPIQVALQSDPIACAGDSTGQITATVTDAQGAVNFQWSPSGPNGSILAGVPAGDYTVVVTDAAGCSDDASISVTEVPALDLNCGAIAESNVGAADGKIGFTISGGSPTYSFLLNGLSVTRPAQDTFRNLTPGNYTIEVTDSNGCMTSCTAAINPGGCGAFTLSLDLTQPDCDNAAGEATVTPISANGMVSYQWAHGPTSASLTNLAPGDYSVTATDAFACTSIQEFTVNAFTDFPGLTVDTFAVICSGDCAEVNYVLSGPEPVTYFFTLDQAGTQVQGQVTESRGPGTLTLCPADFGFADFANTTVTFDSVTAINGCSRSINAVRDIILFPASTGSISPTICATDTFFLAGEAFHATRTNGDVILPNASANGCDSTVAVNISFFAPATGALAPTVCATDTFFFAGQAFHATRTSGDVTLPNASTNGCDSTVAVSLNFFAPATGALAPTICATDTFFFAGQAFHATRTSGDVTLPNASTNGCDSTVAVSLNFFAPATGALAPTICATDTFFLAGEAFHATRTSGDVILPNASTNGCDSTVAVSLDFFAPATGALAPTICATDTFFLAGEAFHATRTSGDVILPNASTNGCDSTVAVSLDFFAPATGALAPTICATDTFFLAGEAFHATRTSGDVTLPNASANGCDSTVAVSLDFFAPATGALAPTICATDTFFLAGEAFHATRTNGDVILPNASANGCDSTVAVSLDFFAAATGALAPTICATDTFFFAGQAFHATRTSGDVTLPNASTNGCDSTVAVSLNFFAPATGALAPTICATDTFFFAGQAFHATRTSGDVILPNASTNGCDSTVAVSLNFFAPVTGALAPTICATDTFFFAGQAFHATRTNGDVILPNASANGCDSTVAVSLNFFAPATAALSPIVCATDTFSLGGEVFHAGRTMGDVRLENAASNGCDSIITVTLDFYPQLTGVFDTTICTGSSFTYGGRLFTQAVDDQLVALPITTANGCDSLVSVTVRERAVPSVSISGDGIVCADGLLNISITYDGPAEANVELSSNPGDIISLVSGTTTIQRPVPVGTEVTIITAEDGGPCPLITSGSITVSETDLGARIEITSGDGIYAVSCAGGEDGQVMAIPTGGLAPFSYDWNTGDDTPMVGELGAGDYSLIVTSDRGCQASASVRLTEPDTLVVQLREIPATCVNPTPSLVIQNISGGVEPFVYSTNGGNSFFPVINFPDTAIAQVGRTTFVLEDSKGCILNQEFEFDPAPVGDIIVTPDFSVITLGESVEITVLTDLNAAGYQLIPGPDSLIAAPSFFVAPDTTTLYQVTAVDDDGCTVSGESLVVVDRFIPVYAPTAFSPNQDGNNDLYRIYGRRNVASFSNFSIFDRWGNRVFDFPGPVGPRDENWGWDGRTIDGKLRQSGVYVFSVTVTFTDGRTKEVKGDLVLVR